MLAHKSALIMLLWKVVDRGLIGAASNVLSHFRQRMASDPSQAADPSVPSAAASAHDETGALAAANGQQQTATSASAASAPAAKIDPITAVQDSIDSLALSLFEALRGVRDAVAPDSLGAGGGASAAGADAPVVPASAFQEPNDEMDKDATARERLLNGLNPDYFPPRAFDLLEPDYESFVMAYLGDNPYAKELVDRFAALTKKSKEESDDAKGSGDGATSTAPPASTSATAAESAKETDQSTVKKIELGDVGYEFRKKFDAGWFTGKVVEVKPLAENGYDRRCVYTDGDIEDLRLEDLQELAKLDPNYNSSSNNNNNNSNSKKPRLSIKLNASKAKQPAADQTNIAGSAKSGDSAISFPMTQAEYTKLLLDTEHQRDVQTTQLLAKEVLAKSAAVDDLVARLPGMNRTRQMQMERIEELIRCNHEVSRDLEEAYATAGKRREEVRSALDESTCLALGVEEDT